MGAEVEIGGVGYGLVLGEGGEEGGGREVGWELDGVGEVDLVGVAGGDVGFYFLDGGEVVVIGDAEGGVGEDGIGMRCGCGGLWEPRSQKRDLGHPGWWWGEEEAGGVVEEDGWGVGGEVG